MRLSLLLLVFTGFQCLAFSQPGLSHQPEDIACREMASHARHMEAASHVNPLTENYDLKYYRFEWDIDPALYYIKGSATVYFQTLEADFHEIHFDFSSELGIDSILHHGQTVGYTQTPPYLLTIHLPDALPSGIVDSLTIAYAGAPPASGLGSFVQSTHNGTPVLWTLSDPFGSQDWWPCKNGLGDKIDSMDVIITTPQAYRAASNGALIAESTIGDQNIFHWRHRYPITPYLVAIAVTNYSAYTDTVMLGNGVALPMLNFVYPENLNDAKSGTANLGQVLQFYDSLFVTYPFYEEKYGHAQFGWSGGMEHQTMSFVFNFNWSLLAHELAHQWFGDMVTCRSFEDIWLSEGFATYLEGLTQERFLGEANWTNWKAGRINNITSQAGGSVRVPDTTNVARIFNGRLSYSKGAYLLHMLRWKLGDEAFYQGVRNYLNEFAFDYAKTFQLQAHLEATSGTDLSEFFADWYFGEGYPSYTLTWEQEDNRLLVQIDQTTSHPSVDFFEMPVPVRLLGSGVDTLLRLDHEFSGQLFVIPLDFDVETVQFDPDRWLISRNNIVMEGDLMTGTTELPDGLLVRVYPNPAADVLTLQLDGPLTSVPYQWEIRALSGNKVLSGEITTGSRHLDLSQIPAGPYVILVTDDLSGRTPILFLKQ